MQRRLSCLSLWRIRCQYQRHNQNPTVIMEIMISALSCLSLAAQVENFAYSNLVLFLDLQTGDAVIFHHRPQLATLICIMQVFGLQLFFIQTSAVWTGLRIEMVGPIIFSCAHIHILRTAMTTTLACNCRIRYVICWEIFVDDD